MTKGKKWTLRLLGVAVLALLICLCLMGNTMARYTSMGDGSGSLTVALWDLETTDVVLQTGESVSPASEDLATYQLTYGNVPRSNTSNWMIAFGLKNNSAVDAKVQVAADSTVSLAWPASNWTWGTGWTYAAEDPNYGRNQTNDYGSGIMAAFSTQENFAALVNSEGIFSIVLGYGDGTEQGTTTITEDTWVDVKMNTTVNFYAEVVWTSADASTSYGTTNYGFSTVEAYADAIDSILGMYVTTLSFGVTWTAVQDSVQPTTTP